MLKLYKVEQRVEDYPGKFDIDIYIVGAENDAKAIIYLEDFFRREGYGIDKDRTTYRSTQVHDIVFGKTEIGVSIPFIARMGDRVLDTNKE